MKTLKITLIIMIVITFFGCGPRVTTKNPANTNLENYETFAFLPNTNAKVENKAYSKEDVNSMVINAISENLKEEGYRLDRSKPDLLVLVSTKTDAELATDTDAIYATYPYTTGISTVAPYYDPYYYYGYADYSNIIGYNYDVYNYKQGTLVIRLVDRQTKETVWKGVAKDAIYNETTKRGITKMVDDIFEEFPKK
ncbi:DUF4136 domain-containing protein [Christiangramia fulva]|nr:DUF4136 domain-containing protein [Christiangramia fulva]